MSKKVIAMSYFQKIKDLLISAVMDEFVCGRCYSPLEPDAEFCGLCGWKNPLIDGGFI